LRKEETDKLNIKKVLKITPPVAKVKFKCEKLIFFKKKEINKTSNGR